MSNRPNTPWRSTTSCSRPPGSPASSTRPVEAPIARLLVLAIALAIALSPTAALAHPTHAGTLVSHIKPEESKVDVLFSIIHEDLGRVLRLDTDGNNIVDLDELRAGEGRMLDYLERTVAVSDGGERCEVSNRRLVRIEQGDARAKAHFYLEYTCPEPLTRIDYTVTSLYEDEGGYRHYGRVQLGERVFSAAFNPDFSTFTVNLATPGEGGQTGPGEVTLADPPSVWATMGFYLWEGVLHIIFGYDHVLFVICLLLVARRFKNLAGVITAFTAGHTVTLILSALGVVTVPPRIIESIIALSIVYVAAENSLRPEEEPRFRYLVTGAFGLIHGFGFSYVLRDDVGLPTDALVPALLSFNVGVELGQIAIVAVCWPLLRRVMDKEWYRYVVWGGSGAVMVLALYWFVERAFFG